MVLLDSLALQGKNKTANCEKQAMKKGRNAAKARGTSTKETERQIQMKQTARKPDQTLADKQKDQAGASATFGQRDRTELLPIAVFASGRTFSYFPGVLLVIDT